MINNLSTVFEAQMVEQQKKDNDAADLRSKYDKLLALID